MQIEVSRDTCTSQSSPTFETRCIKIQNLNRKKKHFSKLDKYLKKKRIIIYRNFNLKFLFGNDPSHLDAISNSSLRFNLIAISTNRFTNLSEIKFPLNPTIDFEPVVSTVLNLVSRGAAGSFGSSTLEETRADRASTSPSSLPSPGLFRDDDAFRRHCAPP